MAKIIFPKRLDSLLEDGRYQPSIRALADRVGEILSDNKLPFFPDYTDHGVDHINCVLKSEVELVPDKVWEQSTSESSPRLLCDADAVVIIGATLLHDIAMHLREDGFLELVGKDSRYKPIPWFNEDHEGHVADRPWDELWDDYAREARRLSERDSGSIIGEQSAHAWKFEELPEDTGRWELNHRLIVGEFIRRHHARLAHEIAIYGFPGLPVGSGEHQFPAMGTEDGHMPKTLADLIGLTARSHGTTLRVCKAYLDASPSHAGTPRPMGTAVLYPMALLRVADYLQLDKQRAPAVLLQLRNPQSPISVQEWKKHRAVQHIGPATDPRGKMVTVSTDITLTLYLQLRDLLAGLQAEMDQSSAVLDEAYGTLDNLGLDKLGLATRRLHSNLNSPAFRDSLPFVPEKTGFATDPNILSLLVEPLYGNDQTVGIRELTQNALDAVRELEAWCENRGIDVSSLDLPEQAGDVLMEYVQRDDGTWFLRVRDRGIGMNADTIQNFYLRAGASFRRSPEWTKEFLGENGQPRVVRAGRFGIGVFAVFLLGESFRMCTRYVDADRTEGYMLDASVGSQFIEISRRPDLQIGTTVEVDISHEFAREHRLEGPDNKDFEPGETHARQQAGGWFCWDWPSVVTRIVRGPNIAWVKQGCVIPIRASERTHEWSVIHPDGYDAVYWGYGLCASISCNGICVMDSKSGFGHDGPFDWPEEEIQLNRPSIAVVDSRANLPLNIQRYGLTQRKLPFGDELARDVTLSYIAHALLFGPKSCAEALSTRIGDSFYDKFRADLWRRDDISGWGGGHRWCATASGMVLEDPWLYGLLGTSSSLFFGGCVDPRHEPKAEDMAKAVERLDWSENTCYAISSWFDYADLIFNGIGFHSESDEVGGAVRMPGSLGPPRLELDVVGLHTLFASRGVRGGRSKCGVLKMSNYNSLRKEYFEIILGDILPSISLAPALQAMSDAIENSHILFVAEARTNPTCHKPETLLAELWNECLGPKDIPFDPVAREKLIESGRKHPELNRHICAWEMRGRNGVKWGERWEESDGI